MPAYRKIIAGFRQFRENTYSANADLFRKLALGQSPKVMIVSCCDSRVDPAILTSSDPGELFVLRNVANLVPPCEDDTSHFHGTSAALEFAVFALEVDYIVVLGHSGCGGIRALLAGDPEIGEGRQFINKWVQIADPARDRTLAECADRPFADQLRFCEMEAVKVSLDNLVSFPWISERVQDGTLSLQGWYFDIAEAAMQFYEAETDTFRSL